MPVTPIQSKDPTPRFPNLRIHYGAPELYLRHVGANVYVADIRGIKTFTLREARAILDICAIFVDWSS
eukprot:4246072-Lingulodinium_polyedra.AAC.1